MQVEAEEEGKAMTKDEKNWLIASWLEPKPVRRAQQDHESITPRESAGGAWFFALQGSECKPRDFYLSEEANALVLEKLPAVELYHHAQDGHAGAWRCRADWGQDESTYSNDRKTAVVEMALKLLAEAKR